MHLRRYIMKARVTLLIACLLLASQLTACKTSDKPSYNVEECQELLRKADELRDNPEQRSTVLDRWTALCT